MSKKKTFISLNADQQRLVEENLKLVNYTISRYFNSSWIEREDLVSYGYIGLCRAAGTFKPDTGLAFCTYAVRCISNFLSNIHKVQGHRRTVSGPYVDSLNEKLRCDSYECEDEVIDYVPDEHVDVERDAINNVLCESLMQYVPTLSYRERTESTYREMAPVFGLSHQRIHRICDREARAARAQLIKGGIFESGVA